MLEGQIFAVMLLLAVEVLLVYTDIHLGGNNASVRLRNGQYT